MTSMARSNILLIDTTATATNQPTSQTTEQAETKPQHQQSRAGGTDSKQNKVMKS
jgi:hypothetical protein